ncbi:MAG: metalloregulator ArsR/SmtB family transcription factor [Gammaproteobacteria bacterium]|nr:metalloregulator ArsR/SmtB family transcription factor [Gammaproteobacteria bacterium]
MSNLLPALRAIAEPTRLRLLAVLAHGERTVSELTEILGQSQPRISRHLKLMVDTGLLERHPEGAWVFFRLTRSGTVAELRRSVLGLTDAKALNRHGDVERLERMKQRQLDTANQWFERNAKQWDKVRERFISEDTEASALVAAVGEEPVPLHIDLGTGTGRVLELLAPLTSAAIGIDTNREMLSIARARLADLKLRHCQVRQGDLFRLQIPDGSVDLVTVHHVLHFVDDPAAAIESAARTLRPSGRLLIVDFARHALEELRSDYHHRHLGFSDDDIKIWFEAAGLIPTSCTCVTDLQRLEALATRIWCARQNDGAPDVQPLDAAASA